MGMLMPRLILRTVANALSCVEGGVVGWGVLVGVVLVGGLGGDEDGVVVVVVVGVVLYSEMTVMFTSIEVVVSVVGAEVKALTSVDELTIAVDSVEDPATTLDELETPVKVVTESVRAEAVASKFREAGGTSSLLRLNSGL